MRPYRIVVPFALVLATAAVPAAHAATARKPPVCLQVADDTGDAKAFGVSDSATLDIVSGDLATGKRNLVAALRLKTLEQDKTQTTGVSYIWSWTVGGASQSLAYYVYVTGETAGRFDADTTGGTITDEVDVPVVADPTTSTITWTVSRKLVPALKKAGAKFTGLTLTSKSGLNQRLAGGEGRSQIQTADQAQSAKTYVDGTATCLKGT